MQDVIEEYSVHILKRIGSKESKLRVLLIENVPHIRLTNSSNKMDDIDISSAAKSFIKFSSNNFKYSVKLLLKKQQFTVYFTDQKIFNECRNCIDKALMTYHQNNRSNDNLFFKMQDNKSETCSSNDDNYPDQINLNESFRKSSLSDPDEFIFNMDYTISEFILNSPSMKGGYINLETPPFRHKAAFRDSNIFVAMKIREESCNPGGVKVSISNKFIEDIIVKSVDKKLWISDITNWDNIKGTVHIGDRVMAVNENPINDIPSYYLSIMNCKECTLTLQRLPNAKVFAFDKRKLDTKMIKLDKKKFYLSKSERSRDMTWQITEINRMNTININEENIISNIQCIINSKFSFLALVIQPSKFIKSLTDNSSLRSPH